MAALGIAIFLELAGGVLFLLGSPLGSCLLVSSSQTLPWCHDRSVDLRCSGGLCAAWCFMRCGDVCSRFGGVAVHMPLRLHCHKMGGIRDSARLHHAGAIEPWHQHAAMLTVARSELRMRGCCAHVHPPGGLCLQATFLIAVTPVMHAFWTLKEGSQEHLVDMCVPPHTCCAHAKLPSSPCGSTLAPGAIAWSVTPGLSSFLLFSTMKQYAPNQMCCCMLQDHVLQEHRTDRSPVRDPGSSCEAQDKERVESRQRRQLPCTLLCVH